MKKSQITFFIIFAAILVLIASLIVYSSKFLIKTKNAPYELSRINADRIIIKEYMQNCIAQVSYPLIFEIAGKGGSFNPNSGAYWNGTELNSLAYYKSGAGYLNNLLLRQDMGRELSDAIKQNLKSCINLSIFREKGYEISENENTVNATINDNSIVIKLEYPLKFKIGPNTIDFNEFSSILESSLGEIYGAAIDIVNEEITYGYFDKEDFMLKHGSIIRVEKHKPYPDIVYIISKTDSKLKKDLAFRFAIKGKDTAGKEILNYGNSFGCCTNKADGICFKNTDPSKCLNNIYQSNINCGCPKNLKSDAEGCCVVKEQNSDTCELTDEKACSSNGGKFYKDDFRCAKADCANWSCRSTYNYVKDDFSGPSKKHGESWCSYESIVGKGLDYVGTRHYLHSCIEGKEYVEECRDFREELCAEGIMGFYDQFYSKGFCRVNRWYDCADQKDESSCKDENLRDCYWSGFLYSQLKCHPEVPPGFKFWKGDGKAICNSASLDKDDYGNDYPKSWGHSALLYCQRTGDCGNYRNIAEQITEFGYYNRDIIPEQWAYFDNGYTKRGDEFGVKLRLYSTDLSKSALIARGTSGGYARCDIWEAPFAGDCQSCSNSKLHPCTEYRCRSLGKNCNFRSSDNACSAGKLEDIPPPKISLNKTGEQSGFKIGQSLYYKDALEYSFEKRLGVHEPFSFQFETSNPTRCRLSIFPPAITPESISNAVIPLPEILLNDYDYKTKYNVTIRFPSSKFTQLNAYNLFLRCFDRQGTQNEETIIKIGVQETANDNAPPEILNITARNRVKKEQANGFLIFTNEPFNLCKYSFYDNMFESMNSINCTTEERNIIYDINYPLGSYACNANIFLPENSSQILFSCEDKSGNRNENYLYKFS